MKLNKGFTLIELLVVIAIIGILSSVVLASLNTARDKGSDAAVKANLNGARPQAELYYDDNSNSYVGVCLAASTGDIAPAVTAAASATGATYTEGNAVDPTASAATCHDASNGWAAMAPLNSSTTEGWCVDSTGFSGNAAYSVLTTDGDVTCS